MPQPTIDLSFPHRWQAQVLAARPAILPARSFVYPASVDEVERGALEVLIRPAVSATTGDADAQPFLDVAAQPFLATCALGFRDPAVPTGLWSAPNADEVCAVSGGYAYVIDTTAPEKFTMIVYRPVLEVRVALADNLLLFIGNRTVLAWGANGQAWESAKLSDEGLTITAVEPGVLRGLGWDLISDKETPFAVDLSGGRRMAECL